VPSQRLEYLPPTVSEAERQRLRDEGATVVALRRRGNELGFLARWQIPAQPEDLTAPWSGDLPIHLPGVLQGGLEVFTEEIQASGRMFDRLRDGARFLEELEPRLAHQERFVPAGSTVDTHDDREIEKVWMSAVEADSVLAEELWAKLSWISRDPSDRSMRISFSHGVEQLKEWREDAARASFADGACQEAFPECLTITGHVPLIEALEALLDTHLRFSERIVYSNAPNGGAVFHHDVEPEQRGVIFGQLSGRTAWLALPKHALARHLRDLARGDLAARANSHAAALAVLDDESDAERNLLLNADPTLTQSLVEAGAAFILEPGDAILLPNHGADATCWHSVFSVGRASLAHSYGIFSQE